MGNNLKKYIFPCVIFIIMCFIISGFSSWITASNINFWYMNISKPSFTPPAWLFAPVWSVLYVLIGIAGGILWHSRKKETKAFYFYLMQLILNFSWSFVFFGAHQIGMATIILILIVVFVLMSIISAWQHQRAVSYLLLPYLCWVSFAMVLNITIFVLN
jgi:tryptophan-rich sensory protein